MANSSHAGLNTSTVSGSTGVFPRLPTSPSISMTPATEWLTDIGTEIVIEIEDVNATLGPEDGPEVRATWNVVLISIIYGVLIVLTVVGNAFVMIAYHRDIRIRRSVANTFILNLAIADFIVGAFTLPVYFAWNITGVWIFGEYLCKAWSFVDFTVTAMSVITIILISVDRYWMLSKKTKYVSFQTKLRVNTTIGVFWVFVCAAYLTLTFGWSTFVGKHAVDYNIHCDMEFVYYLSALLTVIIINFAVPAVIIAVLNTMVYYKIRERARGIQKLNERIRRESGAKITQDDRSLIARLFRKKKEPALALGVNGLDPGVILVSVSTRNSVHCHHNPAFDQPNEVAPPTSSSSTSIHESSSKEMNSDDSSDDEQPQKEKKKTHQKTDNSKQKKNASSVANKSKITQDTESSPSRDKGSKLEVLISKLKRKQRDFRRERRAAFILAVLVTVFIICWLPFNITVIIGFICDYECIPMNVFIVVENLVWVNSALNPILYAATNVHFKRNFLMLLGCKRMAKRIEGPTSVA